MPQPHHLLPMMHNKIMCDDPVISVQFLTGKLSKEVDMNWIPQIQESFKSELVAELPPPLPPKMLDSNSLTPLLDQGLDHSGRNLPKSREIHTLAPALPPKPINRFAFQL